MPINIYSEDYYVEGGENPQGFYVTSIQKTLISPKLNMFFFFFF